MTKRKNHKLTIRHQKYMLVCPTKIHGRSRMLNPVCLSENFLTRHRGFGDSHQSFTLPDLPSVFTPVLRHRATTGNQNHNEDGNCEPNDNLAVNCSTLTMCAHVAHQVIGLNFSAPFSFQLIVVCRSKFRLSRLSAAVRIREFTGGVTAKQPGLGRDCLATWSGAFLRPLTVIRLWINIVADQFANSKRPN